MTPEQALSKMKELGYDGVDWRVTDIPDDPEIPPVTRSGNAVQGASEQGFQNYKRDSVFRFPVDLRNGQEVAAETTFEVNRDNVQIEYTLKLTHKPKGKTIG